MAERRRPPPLPVPLPLPFTPLPEGWRCPDCRHVYGPQVTECSRCPQRTLGDRLRGAADKPIKFGSPPRDGDIL